MKTILKPIALNERSYNVTLLHKALEALGLPVSKREVAQSKAGEDTLKQVRTLRAQLNVHIDDSVIVDEATSLAITKTLKERGLTAASRSFTVTGSVRLQNGAVKKRQKLLAFDLDLRSVAVYRTIQSLAEIQKNAGFEFLGEAVSDNLGNYCITFYDWQYGQAERKKADVVVYALEEEKIIGHSRIVNSEDYSDKGLVRDLDVLITKEDRRTEYKILMKRLNAFLKQSETSLEEIAGSRDQLKFTASELDIKPGPLMIAASASWLIGQDEDSELSHELLYGIGRQNTRLSWLALYKHEEQDLRKAIEISISERVIRRFKKREITAFLQKLYASAVRHILEVKDTGDKNSLNAMLSSALPEHKQRVSFITALGTYQGDDSQEFWGKYLPNQDEFRDKPELISDLLFTQQLILLSDNYQPMVHELQVSRRLSSMSELMDFSKNDWIEIIRATGVPDYIEGGDDEDRIGRYTELVLGQLNSAFPALRIAKMIGLGELPVNNSRIAKSIEAFITNNSRFDFSGSRIHDFDDEIRAVAGNDFGDVRSEMMRIQRVYQVSTTPDVMSVLLTNGLDSSYSIANIPRKSFIKEYADQFGGDSVAHAIHQRASHISTRAEMNAMHMMEYSHGAIPSSVMGKLEYDDAKTALENQVPNYSELFGSPDICECRHCRSVYSAAAYFVDLMRFLWRGETNHDGKSPLQMLTKRRPDLLHLPLTCENTNTLIPYIDLANEIMEYYAANNSLMNFEGYNTGEASSAELRANPQFLNIEAYRKLKDAVFPFSLPYHQPLDVIRTYSDHLTVSRFEAMQAINPQADSTTRKAMQAESLRLGEEEYAVLTGETFDGTPAVLDLHEYYGYANAAAFASMQDETDADGNPRGICSLLERTGLAYTELLELVKTDFINPYQDALEFMQRVFASSAIDANGLYSRLVLIEAATLDPATDVDIVNALNDYNAAVGSNISPADFAQWVSDHFSLFQKVITLYEPDSKCALDTTSLRTIQSIYEGLPGYGLSNDDWSKIHRFIRLWRKLGWSMHETDLVLAAVDESDIGSDAIARLETISLLKAGSRRPLNQLAVMWGNIDTCGDRSLYKKLFLNRAVQQIDAAFKADAWGNYLQREVDENGDPITLAGHQSTILAAFRIRSEDLEAIVDTARVIDAGNPRKLDPCTDILNIQNLSTLYRHVMMAKALKMRVTDVCKLISLFNVSPFSTWDIQQEKYTGIEPEQTYKFYKLAAASRAAGFKPVMLEYILQGSLPADSKLGLDRNNVLQTVQDIRNSFVAIEQDHPQTPAVQLSSEILAAKLSLSFQADKVSRLMDIIDASASFETITDSNLNLTIPDDIATKYTYIEGSGRLVCTGIMSDSEQATLKSLVNASPDFQSAVDLLYAAPVSFISENFSGVFTNPVETEAILLDHPAQSTKAVLDEKLGYVYQHFLPVLKYKIRKDAITRHIAALIGLSDEATAILIAGDIDLLLTDLAREGFSATYFSDASWSSAVLERFDDEIDFSWGSDAPDPLVPVDNFSADWKAYITAPASGEYTLVVDVAEADDVFRLYLDGSMILDKAPAVTDTSLEIVVGLNAAQMHLLTLEYAENSQNAGISLRWKTDTSALTVIPASVAYPASTTNAFVNQASILHRAARFIEGFDISETELDHLINYSTDFGNIDFRMLNVSHWHRIHDYTILRKSVAQSRAQLTDVFALANRTDPLPVLDDLSNLIHQATDWDVDSLRYLIVTHFSLGVSDFKNEIALNQIKDVMEIVRRTGVSAQTITQWAMPETDFDTLHAAAQLLKNTVKAKYEREDWLDVGGNLSDKLRENQKQALINYLLMQPAVKDWGARDADSLFEYFLIDVQMGACMDTSRVVQANAALQMFVNRCLLNLESDMSSGNEKGVSPGAIDKERWQWMKNYRVWEANRKVFLYPENWLEPEWRNNRSELFRALESYLMQNDITDRSVEQGFRQYLTSLNEVANLEVCGMYEEKYENGKLKLLHVFGHTHTTPYKYYYRTWDKYRKWSAWEKVELDIRNVEDGDNSGVHLVPVVWRNRLYLFWPEFIEVTEEQTTSDTQTINDIADSATIAFLTPKKCWKVRLAWSEYVDGKWTSKQITKGFVKQEQQWHYRPDEAGMRFAIEFWPENRMRIYLLAETGGQSEADERLWYLEAFFEFADVNSKVVASSDGAGWAHEQWAQTYLTDYMNVSGYSDLQLHNQVYLKSSVNHSILLTPTVDNFDPDFQDPFFYSDKYRTWTYFVRPAHVRNSVQLKFPDKFYPLFPGLVDDSALTMPIEIPDVGPDDYLPGAYTMTVRSGNLPATSARIINNAAMTVSYVDEAFAAANDAGFAGLGKLFAKLKKGLEFHTFYHPFSSDYVTRFSDGGMPGLMQADTDITSDEGVMFEDSYDPDFSFGKVRKVSAFPDMTLYRKNVCFDVYGANSLYNWELFFHAPLYIATRLSKNGKYEQAMKWFHYIFDPTTDDLPGAGESEISRYWKVLPFKTTPKTSLEQWFRDLSPNADPDKENAIIGEWRDNPFDPHLVASNRPLAYMKHVVIKYVENLVAWGDSLFRQFTRESVNEALQLYVIANHILGPRPEFVPRRGEIKAESYESLKHKWDDFSNALVELENIFPYSSEVSVSSKSPGSNLLGLGSALYFCIPANNKLLEYWDTVSDRLFKIRHCRDIEGVERELALFAPPIDPAALIQAASQGLSLGSILSDLSSPPPIYRFSFLMQKTNEFCADVKALGSTLLATLEKKDAEELSRLRASHETGMLERVKAVRERRVLDARVNRQNLIKARQTAEYRLQHFNALMGNEPVSVPAAPSLTGTLSAYSRLPADTNIQAIVTEVDTDLVESGEQGVNLIPKELEELEQSEIASDFEDAANVTETISSALYFIPEITLGTMPWGVGSMNVIISGTTIGLAGSAFASGLKALAAMNKYDAQRASKLGTYIRREQEWSLQANLAVREIIQLDKQITSAEIQIEVAEKELENHEQQIENAKEVELFLKDKFTNQELYQWMKEQLFAIYKQSYNLAYDMARKTEKAYKFERGTETASFIQYGYWDNSKQGLVAGEKLQQALRQMEKSYLEENRRELELTKSISMALLNPLALIELRETGKCYLSLPEELFDLDFQSHYFRRIKSVSLTIPCVAGPYTTVNCSLRLLKNVTRINTSMNREGKYEHENDEGLWIDDDRFRSTYVPVTSIATSSGQNDSGMFEFNFRDERYLPFEGAGVISDWMIALTTEKEFRQFDYASISDVILHIRYMARESGGLFKENASTYIKDFITNAAELSEQPLMRMFSMKHEFPTEWHKFLHPTTEGEEQVLSFTIGKQRFPFFTHDRNIVPMRLEAFAKCTQAGDYHMVLSYINFDEDTVTSSEITMPQNENYGGLNKATINVNDAGLNLEEQDITGEMSLKVKYSTAPDYKGLATKPDEVEDIFLVIHYKLAES